MDLDVSSLTDPALRALAVRQAGVLRRPDLVRGGATRSKIDAELDGRRWQTCGPNVVVLHNGPLSVDQQQWVAVVNAGPDAALAGRTAAAVGGLTGWDDGKIHIVVRRGDRPPPVPGLEVTVHESRRFDPRIDILPSRYPPRVRLERAVVDAAAWTSRGRPACGLVLAAVQQRLTTAVRLRSALRAVGRVQHVAVMRAVLSDLEGGADALSEVDFGKFCRRHRLGTPVRQSIRLDRNGRRRYIDAMLTRSDGSAVSIEIDGAVHLLAETYWSDCARSNEIVIGGDSLLRFPTVALYLAEDEVADQLRRALAGTRR